MNWQNHDRDINAVEANIESSLVPQMRRAATAAERKIL